MHDFTQKSRTHEHTSVIMFEVNNVCLSSILAKRPRPSYCLPRLPHRQAPNKRKLTSRHTNTYRLQTAQRGFHTTICTVNCTLTLNAAYPSLPPPEENRMSRVYICNSLSLLSLPPPRANVFEGRNMYSPRPGRRRRCTPNLAYFTGYLCSVYSTLKPITDNNHAGTTIHVLCLQAIIHSSCDVTPTPLSLPSRTHVFHVYISRLH